MKTLTADDLSPLRGKMVYIAGPYRADNGRAVIENVRLAESVAMVLVKAGVHFHCPHLNTGFMCGLAPEEFFLDMDLDMLRRCDAILMIGDWRNSAGARAELDVAAGLSLGQYELEGGPMWT